MGKNRKIFIILIVAVLILIVLTVGVIAYFTLIKGKNNGNIEVKQNHNIDFEISDIEETENREIENNLLDESEKIARQSFNNMFETYKGTENDAMQIKQLISQIETNNSTREDEHIVTLDTQGITDRNQVSLDKIYEVQTYYDDNGYINKILIAEKKNAEEIIPGEESSEENMDKLIFNTQFTTYTGTITGSQLLKLISIGQEVNETSTHKIKFKSSSIKTMDLSTITDEQKFEVTLGYDDAGYVNVISINAK